MTKYISKLMPSFLTIYIHLLMDCTHALVENVSVIFFLIANTSMEELPILSDKITTRTMLLACHCYRPHELYANKLVRQVLLTPLVRLSDTNMQGCATEGSVFTRAL